MSSSKTQTRILLMKSQLSGRQTNLLQVRQLLLGAHTFSETATENNKS